MNDTPEITARKTDARLESIWKRQDQELHYWINEWKDGCGCKNISIHFFDEYEKHLAIIFDADGKDAILLETDTMAETAEESQKYMILSASVIEKLASVFALPAASQA